MKFCEICNNMLLSKIEKETETLKYFCKSCNNIIDQDIHDNCVYNSNKNDKDSYKLKINKYTHLDPTIPRVNNIDCPNKKCNSKLSNNPDHEILYIKYNNADMKFIYLCKTCKFSWKT